MSFEWDELSTEEDFFAIVEQGEKETEEDKKVSDFIETGDDNEKSPPEKEKAGKKTKVVKPDEGEDDEEDFDDLFSAVDEEGEDFDDEKVLETIRKEKDVELKSDNISVLNILKEKGFVDFELGEDEELTEELAAELVEEGYEATIEERIVEKMEQLPDDAKHLIMFAIKGGSVSEYFQKVHGSTVDLDSDVDFSDEDTQEEAMRQLLSLEESDQGEIEDRIEYLKERGALESAVKKKFEKYSEQKEASKKEALAAQEEARKEARIQEREAIKSFKNIFIENKNIGGLPVSRKHKNEIPAYAFERSVKLANGNSITPLQRDFHIELPKNQLAMAQMAILMNNRNADGTFNFEAISKIEKTIATKKLKDEVRRTSGGSSREVKTLKSLSSYFNE